MKKLIKVAISGLGNIGIKHFKSIIKNKKIQLTNVFDVDSKKNKIFRKNGIINNFNNIFKNKLNAIIISSPDENHCDQIKKSLIKGVNVFCEKPLCNSSSELNSIYKTWKNNKNLRIKTNLLLRKVEIYIWLKKKLNKTILEKSIVLMQNIYMEEEIKLLMDGEGILKTIQVFEVAECI